MKLIAEPWDVGEGGYQVGNFPPLWTEWNGKYRDTVRDFWRGSYATMPEFASRLTGSSDLYEHSARRPFASINFVTCHDGFIRSPTSSPTTTSTTRPTARTTGTATTTAPGTAASKAPPRDPAILDLRARQRRNCLPGDPLPVPGRADAVPRRRDGTHAEGSNNAYCQDNEIAWVRWEDSDDMEFVRILSRLRHDHPVFRRRRFFTGRGTGAAADIAWLTPAYDSMTDQDWNVGFAKSLGVFLNGDAITEPDPRGRRVRDDSFLLLINAGSEPVEFTLPGAEYGERWESPSTPPTPTRSATGPVSRPATPSPDRPGPPRPAAAP